MYPKGDLVGQSQETVRQGMALSNVNVNQEAYGWCTLISSPPSKGSHGFLFKFVFGLYYQKPGREACQTSKILSILHGVRFNLATEKSNGDGTLSGKQSHKSCQRCVYKDRVFLSASKTEISQRGFSSKSARQGREMLHWNHCDVCPHPSGHRCRMTVWEQQGCQLWFYTSLLVLNQKLSRS